MGDGRKTGPRPKNHPQRHGSFLGNTTECHAVRGYAFDGPGKRQRKFGDLRLDLIPPRRTRQQLPCHRKAVGGSSGTPHSCV
jgi:hypothetical protein